MRGHETLIQLRKAGRKPHWVFINDYPCKTNWFETGEHATICVYGDSLSSLDLRFLTGLAVSVSASTEKRAKALFNACKQANAKVVAACHVMEDKKYSQQTGWVEVYRA